MVITLLLVLALATQLQAHTLDQIWDDWKQKYGKVYTNDLESVRRQKWERNVAMINEHNLRYDMGLETYTMGLNEFSAMDWDEFKAMFLCNIPMKNTASNILDTTEIGEAMTAEDSVDWRTRGVVTNVKNQLVDCSGSYGNYGCGGGFMNNAFRYAAAYGVEKETDYPYHAQDEICHHDKNKSIVYPKRIVSVRQGSEAGLKQVVSQFGPTSVAIHVTPAFMNYMSGVFSDDSCSPSQLNHGVLTVGYGKDGQTNYWIVKNSWGTNWGENGYIRMRKDDRNMCGIASMASLALLS